MTDIDVLQYSGPDAWFYEPAFKKRFDAATDWMRKYLVKFSDRDDEGRLLLTMDFKCDLPLHEDATADAATCSIRTIFLKGWSLLEDGCTVAFNEIQDNPGYYIFHLTDAVRAVVAKVGERMFFLVLDSEFLTTYHAKREEQMNAFRLRIQAVRDGTAVTSAAA
jgi:hypothetical protein